MRDETDLREINPRNAAETQPGIPRVQIRHVNAFAALAKRLQSFINRILDNLGAGQRGR